MINFSNTTPAAIGGGTNVLWQEDSSGNISGYYAIAKTTVAPVAGVLTLDASLATSFYVNVNAAITSMSIINPSDGEEITILWAQGATGYAITTASNMYGVTAPSTTANTVSSQKFTYNVSDTNWYATGVGVTGM